MDIRQLPVQKSHLQILVYKNLLRAKIDDLVRLAEYGFHLIGRFPFFNLLGLGRRRLWLRLSSTASLVTSLLVISITSAVTVSAPSTLIAGCGIDIQEVGDRICYL